MLQTWTTLSGAVQAELAGAHREMRRALDQEMEVQQAPPVPLPFGKRVDGRMASRNAYEFRMASPRGVREGDQVDCRFPDPATSGCTLSCIGTVIAADPRHLTVAFRDDLGPSLPAGGVLLPRGCVGLMEARERLLRIEAGRTPFNPIVALRMIGQDRLCAPMEASLPRPPRFPDGLPALRGLRLAQLTAIEDYWRLAFAALWGPPGTGKTFVLALGVALRTLLGAVGSHHGATRRPRTLVLGPTNLAVDEAMTRIAAHMDDAQSVREGRVVRYGHHVTPQLVAACGDQIVYDRVVQRIRGERMRRAVDVAVRLETRLDDLQETSDLLANLPLDLDDARDDLAHDAHRLTRYVRRWERLARIHSQRFDDAFRREHSLAQDVMSRCHILGTTVHQALMSTRIRQTVWDNVVIDEASQVPFAMAYAVAVGASETVWIVGDPRQLAPVVAAQEMPARAWMARDAFTVSGSVIDEPGKQVTTAPWVSRLDVQHRMHPEICALVNEAYGGTLRTAPDVATARLNSAVRLPLTHSADARGVYLIDTTSLRPTARRATGGSRTNRTHVAVARALVELLGTHGLAGNASSPTSGIAIVAPYVSQARWIARSIRARFPDRPIRVDTVHAFQGQEVDTVILDLTESPGLDLTEWMYARAWSDDGGRLLTVGCSRARQRLFVIANCGYMYDRLQALAPVPIVLRWLRHLERWGGAVDVVRDIREFALKRRSA